MPYRLSLFVNDLSPANKEKLTTSTVTGLTKLRCFMLQVASALAPSAWGNQLHLFALSLALCRPIFCYSSFLINSSTSNAVQQWAAGYCGTINELCQKTSEVFRPLDMMLMQATLLLGFYQAKRCKLLKKITVVHKHEVCLCMLVRKYVAIH